MLNNVLASPQLHENKLKDRSTKKEENAILSRALGKTKKKDFKKSN